MGFQYYWVKLIALIYLIGLKICGMDCILSAEWKSSSKIIARTGPGKGKGDIIVTTRSGGTGSCTVGFRGFFIQIGKILSPFQREVIHVERNQFYDCCLKF